MAACPQCDRTLSSTAVSCPHCNLQLKAHGHPGIPLHRATGTDFLCDSCTYHADDTCNFPQRPQAKTCTLYQAIDTPAKLSPQEIYPLPWWRKINQFWLAVAILIGLSILVTLL